MHFPLPLGASVDCVCVCLLGLYCILSKYYSKMYARRYVCITFLFLFLKLTLTLGFLCVRAIKEGRFFTSRWRIPKLWWHGRLLQWVCYGRSQPELWTAVLSLTHSAFNYFNKLTQAGDVAQESLVPS